MSCDLININKSTTAIWHTAKHVVRLGTQTLAVVGEGTHTHPNTLCEDEPNGRPLGPDGGVTNWSICVHAKVQGAERLQGVCVCVCVCVCVFVCVCEKECQHYTCILLI